MRAESLLAFARQNMELNAGAQSHAVWAQRVKIIEEAVAVYEWHHWTPPSWLKSGWVAMDMNGKWRWYEARPTIGNSTWINGHGSRSTICFDGPDCNDWMTSLRQVSRGEKTKEREKTPEQIEGEIKHLKANLVKLYTERNRRNAST